MFIARAALGDGEELLVLGLSRANRERLEAGQPMDVSQASHGMAMPAKLRIVIFVGETEDSMREQMRSMIGPETIVDQKRPT
jgi:hypothetical protein